jgi:hypothetical protein
LEDKQKNGRGKGGISGNGGRAVGVEQSGIVLKSNATNYKSCKNVPNKTPRKVIKNVIRRIFTVSLGIFLNYL